MKEYAGQNTVFIKYANNRPVRTGGHYDAIEVIWESCTTYFRLEYDYVGFDGRNQNFC